MKLNQHKLQLRLTVSGDFSPQEFSEAVGIADKQWIKGDINERSSKPYRDSGWQLLGDENKQLDAISQLQMILDRIRPNLREFKIRSENLYVELVFILFTSINGAEIESIPWIHLNKEAIKILAEINAEIDFDLYLIT